MASLSPIGATALRCRCRASSSARRPRLRRLRLGADHRGRRALLVQLAVLSFVSGGSMAAIVLGHWYLVTPKISEKPLILQCQMLLAGLIVQALLFVVWTTLGGGPGQGAVRRLHERTSAAGRAATAGHDRVPDRAGLDGVADGTDALDGIRHRACCTSTSRPCSRGRSAPARCMSRVASSSRCTSRFRLFAMLRQQAGWRERDIELPDGSTIGYAWQFLMDEIPALAPQRDIVRFACNRDYATADQQLSDGDELALIPPVAGGADAASASRSCARRSPTSCSASCATRCRLPPTARSSSSLARRARRRNAVAGRGRRGRATRRQGSRGPRVRGLRRDGARRSARRSRRRSSSVSA